MLNHQSKMERLTGVLCCRRGLSPFTLLKVLHNCASNSTASSSHSTFLYLKCVTFIKVLRFLCSRILDCIEERLLPIYTTVSLCSNSYAPASSGAFLATSSLKGCSLFLVSGIPLLYNTLVIDSNTPLCYPLAKRLEGRANGTLFSKGNRGNN